MNRRQLLAGAAVSLVGLVAATPVLARHKKNADSQPAPTPQPAKTPVIDNELHTLDNRHYNYQVQLSKPGTVVLSPGVVAFNGVRELVAWESGAPTGTGSTMVRMRPVGDNSSDHASWPAVAVPRQDGSGGTSLGPCSGFAVEVTASGQGYCSSGSLTVI